MSIRPPTDSRYGAGTATSSLFDALQKHVLDLITPALDAALGDADDYLFDQSQKGDEDLGLAALRELRRSRAQIVQGFRGRVTARFTELATRRAMSGEGGAGSLLDTGLSLLSDQDLEQQLAVEQLAAAVLRTHGPAFEIASKRMAVVAGNIGMERRDDPLDPVFLASAMGHALVDQSLSDDLRIVVFKFFERELDSALGDLYERCNALMASAGILPELRATNAAAHPRRESARPQQSQQPQPSPADSNQVEAQQRVPIGQPGMPQMGMPQMGMPQMGMPGSGMQSTMQINVADQAMFANMLGQLQGWRVAMGLNSSVGTAGDGGGMAAPSGPTLGTNELLSILSMMQRDTSPILPESTKGGDSGLSIAAQLRKHMGQSARKLGVAGDNVNLDGLDGDAVDLVALLFDVLLDGPQYDTRIRQKIGRMLVPCVKAAIKDRRMFLMKEHPARKLLNTVAEACEGNRGEEPQERELLNHVDHTIDRLVAEFNEDVAIFETLEQELRSFMAQHRKRFELVERRTTEAQWGRERLDSAREAALRDIENHRGDRELPPVIANFLSRHTAHHLVQVALRDGVDSVRYDSALVTVDGLLAALDQAETGKWPDPTLPLPEAGLLEILSSAGFTDSAAHSALEALDELLTRMSKGQAVPEVDARIATQVAPVEQVAPPKLEVVADNEKLDFDASVLERIKALKVGDWLQLATSDQRFAPAKVSWISPISARLLLVNRRGIRVLVASAQELAAMVALDKVRLREGETAFEDAMHQMVHRLQSVNAER